MDISKIHGYIQQKIYQFLYGYIKIMDICMDTSMKDISTSNWIYPRYSILDISIVDICDVDISIMDISEVDISGMDISHLRIYPRLILGLRKMFARSSLMLRYNFSTFSYMNFPRIIQFINKKV